MEGQETLQALAARWPNLRLTRETLAYAPTLNTRALQRLPLNISHRSRTGGGMAPGVPQA